MKDDDTRAAGQGLGRNQHALRDYNERLILTTLSRKGPMAGSEISRATQLSPQTVSVILRQLEQDGMLARGTPQRGRVGKPSVPMGLNPAGAYAIGVMVGRRTTTLILTDFVGKQLLERHIQYDYPMPDPIMAFLRRALKEVREQLGDAGWDRISGIGVAKPYEIWAWHDNLGAPQEDLEAWKSFDFETALSEICPFRVHVENDATSAAQAEQIHGSGRAYSNYAYFFVGAFIGGGVILKDAVFTGPFSNAGAFGSLPVAPDGDTPRQLIDVASLFLLEVRLRDAGQSADGLWDADTDWSAFEPVLSDWIEDAGRHLALAALTVSSVIDFEAVVVDGAFPAEVRKRLVAAMAQTLEGLDKRGLRVPDLTEGSIGRNARAIGAAAYPVHATFFTTPHAQDG